jgi:hypothetical protein
MVPRPAWHYGPPTYAVPDIASIAQKWGLSARGFYTMVTIEPRIVGELAAPITSRPSHRSKVFLRGIGQTIKTVVQTYALIGITMRRGDALLSACARGLPTSRVVDRQSRPAPPGPPAVWHSWTMLAGMRPQSLRAMS